MKTFKKLFAMALALVMLISCFVSCGSVETDEKDSAASTDNASETVTDTTSADDEKSHFPFETKEYGDMGRVVSANGSVFYLKHAADSYETEGLEGYFAEKAVSCEMVRLDGGDEEVIFSVTASGEFVYANDIFFFNGENGVISVDGEGNVLREIEDTTLRGVTEDGRYVILYSEELGIHALNLEKGSLQVLAKTATRALAIRDGYVYFSLSPEDYETSAMGQITLYRINVADPERIELCTTAPDLYDEYSAYGPVTIGQLRFDDEYVYFSYGALGGSGIFWQGGRVIRVKYDGSDATVVAGEEKLVDSQFELDGNGGVITYDTIETAYDEPSSSFEYMGDKIYYYDPVDGKRMEILDSTDYETDGEESLLDYIEVKGKVVYYLVHSAKRDPDNDIGWRAAYIRTGSTVFVKDLVSGTVAELYKF